MSAYTVIHGYRKANLRRECNTLISVSLKLVIVCRICIYEGNKGDMKVSLQPVCNPPTRIEPCYQKSDGNGGLGPCDRQDQKPTVSGEGCGVAATDEGCHWSGISAANITKIAQQLNSTEPMVVTVYRDSLAKAFLTAQSKQR